MGLLGCFFYLFLGVVLFIILLYFDQKYSITRLEKIIISIIFLLIISGILKKIGINYTDNVFLIFLFLFMIDAIYCSYFKDVDFFDRVDNNIEYYFVLIIIGFFINQSFINRVEFVFLTGEDLRLIIWSFVLLFLYYFCKNNDIFTSTSKNEVISMSVDRVLSSYAKLKYRFFDECDVPEKELSNVLYSIMIYHNYHRSKFLRRMDYIRFRLNGQKQKLGIMQVESSRFISDSESILLTYQKLLKLYEKEKSSRKKNKVEEIIKNYCKSYSNEVLYIFDIIKKF